MRNLLQIFTYITFPDAKMFIREVCKNAVISQNVPRWKLESDEIQGGLTVVSIASSFLLFSRWYFYFYFKGLYSLKYITPVSAFNDHKN